MGKRLLHNLQKAFKCHILTQQGVAFVHQQ